jgi:hypothetical protein
MHRFVSGITVILAAILMMGILGCGQTDQQQTQSKAVPEGHNATMGNVTPVVDDYFAVGPFTGDLPEGWVKEQPSSSMRMAQWALPVAEGVEDEAKVLVFYFGPDAGSVEMNITRWMGQFENADGTAIGEDDATRETFMLNDMEVTQIMFTGTQKPSSMMGAPGSDKKPGWMFVSAIVMSPNGPWFFKCTGPEATVQKELGAFRQMLNSLEYSEMNAHHG